MSWIEHARSPAGFVVMARANLRIAVDLAVRDLRTRYVRSSLGFLWFLLGPALMIGVYWTLFGYVLGLSWNDPATGTKAGFIVPFVAALSVYLWFADIVGSSLALYPNKAGYVQKSPFPLWVLWVADLFRSSAQASASFFILLVLALATGALRPASMLWLPPALALVFLFLAALSLALSTLGPFLGDLSEAARVALRVMFYAAPISYPLSIVPERIQPFLRANPLTELIEPVRRAVAFGLPPETTGLAYIVGLTALLGAFGYWAFRRLKGAIADVV